MNFGDFMTEFDKRQERRQVEQDKAAFRAAQRVSSKRRWWLLGQIAGALLLFVLFALLVAAGMEFTP